MKIMYKIIILIISLWMLADLQFAFSQDNDTVEATTHNKKKEKKRKNRNHGKKPRKNKQRDEDLSENKQNEKIPWVRIELKIISNPQVSP